MLCLGCFDSNKSMKNLKNEALLSQYLLETMDIRVCDGLRPWRYICWECEALLLKFVEFRRRVKRLFSTIEDHVQRYIKNEIYIKLESGQENETPGKIEKDIAVLESDTDENSEDFSYDDNMEVYSDSEENYNEFPNHMNVKHSNENIMEAKIYFNKTDNETNIQNLYENSIKEYSGWEENNDEPRNQRNVNHSNNSNEILTKHSNISDKKKNHSNDSDKRPLKVEVINLTNGHEINPEIKIGQVEKVYKTSPTKQRILEQQLMRSVLERKGIKKAELKQKEFKKTSSHTRNRRPFRIQIDPSKIKTIIMNVDEQCKSLEERLNSKEFKSLPYGCSLCGSAYKDKIKLEEHMVLHDKKSGNWECSICHIRIATKHKFSRHQRNHELLYECLVCKYNTCYRSLINQHYTSVHENGITYQCQYCPRVYKYQGAFLEHEKTHISEPKITCETCGKIFHNNYALRKHQVYHTRVKAFACDKCDKNFFQDSQLQAHKVLHSKETETFYCALCDVTFKTKSNYDIHMKLSSKHVNPEHMRYKCSLCPRRFHTPSLLRNHELAHSGNPHHCDICDRSFVVRSALKLHIRRIHEGYKVEKKFMCDKCGKAFSYKEALHNHIRSHTGERPYVCSLCDRAFTQSSSLRTHHKLVHLKIKTAQSFQKKNKKEKT